MIASGKTEKPPRSSARLKKKRRRTAIEQTKKEPVFSYCTYKHLGGDDSVDHRARHHAGPDESELGVGGGHDAQLDFLVDLGALNAHQAAVNKTNTQHEPTREGHKMLTIVAQQFYCCSSVTRGTKPYQEHKQGRGKWPVEMSRDCCTPRTDDLHDLSHLCPVQLIT